MWSTTGMPQDNAARGIELRAFTVADTEVLQAGFADPQIALWNQGPADGDVATWWEARNDWSDGTHASWAVGGPDGALLGSVSVFRVDLDQAIAEIGYFVLPGARGKGVATAAVRAASDYAFGAIGVRRLELFHAVANPASCRVAAAARFALEGTLRQSHRYGDGVWHDEHLHARLRTD
ncbi:MAG TPA: GNAT family protein [Jatrophihabitans sp.]|nr:GNAT family protein [Jatrophihabitans sp.]